MHGAHVVLKGIIFLLLLVTIPAQAADPLEQRLTDLETQEALVRQARDDFARQFEVLRGSRLFHQVLQEQKANMPAFDPVDYSDPLATLRLEYFNLQRRLQSAQLTSAERAQLQATSDTLARQLDLLVRIDASQSALQRRIEDFNALLDEYLFWTPSNPRMDLRWWLAMPGQLADQLKRLVSQVRSAPQVFYFGLDLTGYLLLAGLILLFSQRKRLQGRLTQARQRFESTPETSRSLWTLPSALGLTALLVAPPSLAVLLLGWFIAPLDSASAFSVGNALVALALAGFMLAYLRTLLKDGGMAEQFFGWPPEHTRALKHFVRSLTWVLLPSSFILALAAQQTTGLASDVIGPLTLFAASIALVLILWRLNRTLPLYESAKFQRLACLMLFVTPLSLLLMTSLGYYYSALQLTMYYLITFYLISLWVIAEAASHRTILMAGAQLRHRQRLLEQSLETQSADDPESQPAVPPADIAALDIRTDEALQQSTRLARILLFVLFGTALYLVWSDGLAALHYLDTWLLWQSEEAAGLPLSVGGLLSALVLVVATWLLARNLPGLLEVLVLSRIQLQPGSAYAITSILNYIIVGVGAIAILGTLGVSWDKLQWLAAGLSVGLGFGLQEIFANFISGLILLFERPIRVGDIITLNNLSGRVSKIRIRSTIITDFDRREIVVPNRSFITGQFVNWSLSNTVTRVIVKVGVAYGSDLEKTREILLAAADGNDRVLKDPKPQVLFLNFGDSTLDHELRIHVQELSDRNPAIDEINRYIDRRFKEEDIEIAFQQIDLHLRNGEGLDQVIERLPVGHHDKPTPPDPQR